MTFKLSYISLGAAFCIASGPAVADVDNLPLHRVTGIKIALEQVLGDPAVHPDRLSPERLEAMRQAYETHRPPSRVDDLTHARWTAILAAYRTHDPVSRGFVLAKDF